MRLWELQKIRSLIDFKQGRSKVRSASETMPCAELEVCIAGDQVNSAVTSAEAAVSGGCTCIELCANMREGGLTPTDEVVKAVRAAIGPKIRLRVMVRPHAKSFSFLTDEFDKMQADIVRLSRWGIDGVVCGALDESQSILDPSVGLLIEQTHAAGKEFTFHRAFDAISDRSAAFGQLCEWKCDRILTSGTTWGDSRPATTAIDLLASESQAWGERILIAVGGGIGLANLPVISQTLSRYRFGIHTYTGVLDETSRLVDTEKVRSMAAILFGS